MGEELRWQLDKVIMYVQAAVAWSGRCQWPAAVWCQGRYELISYSRLPFFWK